MPHGSYHVNNDGHNRNQKKNSLFKTSRIEGNNWTGGQKIEKYITKETHKLELARDKTREMQRSRRESLVTCGGYSQMSSM